MGLVCWSHLDSSAVYSTYFGGSSERPKLLTYDSNIPFVGSGITVLSPLTQRITVRIGPVSIEHAFFYVLVYILTAYA